MNPASPASTPRLSPAQRAGHRASRPSGGLSLVEACCCLCIVGLLLAGALPSLRELRQRQAIQAVAAVLETDVQLARSLTRSTDRTVRLALQPAGDAGSCYVLHHGPAGACTCGMDGTARCDAGGQALRVQALPASGGVRLSSASRNIVFDAGKGTVTPTATFVIADADGRALHQIVNVLGRVRSCSPSGLAGYRRCS